MFDILANEAQKENQSDLMKEQTKNQMLLNKQGQKIGLQTYALTSYPTQVALMEQAGLNPALMYGESSGSGGTTSTPSGGSASGGQVGKRRSMDINTIMQAGVAKSQIDLNKAKSENLGADTTTTNEIRPILKENMKQSGIEQWYQNVIQEYKLQDPTEDGVSVYRNAVYGKSASQSSEHPDVKAYNLDLLKTASQTNKNLADINLTNKKIENAWQELMNATAIADAAKIQAAAQKLSVEHHTGEFTNWKTWADLGLKIAKEAGEYIKLDKLSKPRTTTSTSQGDKGYTHTVTTTK